MHKRRGDTLIEVTLAVGIFSMVAIAAVAVLSGGTSSAQTALETTLAREEIDAQSEAIRFIQSAALAENDAEGPYHALWGKIIAKSVEGYSPSSNQSCDAMYSNPAFTEGDAFVINTHALSGYADEYSKATSDTKKNEAIDKVLITSEKKDKFIKTQTYPHLIYGESATDNTDKGALTNDDLATSTLYAAAGIYVVTAPDQGTSNIVGSNSAKGFDDFYVQTCWYGSGSDTASTISTVIRLYNPQESTTQTTPTYKIAYDANGADAYSGGPETQTFKYEGPGKTTTVQDNTFSNLCYNPITAKDIWPIEAADDTRPIWTTEEYSWDYTNGDDDKERLKDKIYLEGKDSAFLSYIRAELGNYNSNGTEKYYFPNNQIAIFPGAEKEAPETNGYITLFAQWHRDYNDQVCSRLSIKYTSTGSSSITETPKIINEGDTQTFIVPDTRAIEDQNKKDYPSATAAAKLPYSISLSSIAFPDSTCKTSANGWKFISDEAKYYNNDTKIFYEDGQYLPGDSDNLGRMLLDALGGTTEIKNITYFGPDNIESAKLVGSSNLLIKKGKNNTSVYFNISCLAPSMQAEVTMDYCIENASNKEIEVRDERDNNIYTVTYVPTIPKSVQEITGSLVDSSGFCMMTQNLRFTGDIEKKEVERLGKIVNIGSNYEGEEKLSLSSNNNNDWSKSWENGKNPLLYIDGANSIRQKITNFEWPSDNKFYELTTHAVGDSGGVGTEKQIINVEQSADKIAKDLGNWYNFYAAFAGYSTTDEKKTAVFGSHWSNKKWVQVDLPDVCPAGWHIPDSRDIDTIANNVSIYPIFIQLHATYTTASGDSKVFDLSGDNYRAFNGKEPRSASGISGLNGWWYSDSSIYYNSSYGTFVLGNSSLNIKTLNQTGQNWNPKSSSARASIRIRPGSNQDEDLAGYAHVRCIKKQ